MYPSFLASMRGMFMASAKRSYRSCVASLSFALLTACAGSSGGSDDSSYDDGDDAAAVEGGSSSKKAAAPKEEVKHFQAEMAIS